MLAYLINLCFFVDKFRFLFVVDFSAVGEVVDDSTVEEVEDNSNEGLKTVLLLVNESNS